MSSTVTAAQTTPAGEAPLAAASPAAPRLAAGREALFVARWPVGGIRTHLAYNVPTLADAGYRCTFVGPEDSLEGLRQTLGHVPGSSFVAAPVRGKSCRLWPTVRSLLRTGRYALVHSHGLTAGVHVVLANFGVGVPHLCTVHDPLRDEQFRGWKGAGKRWLMGRLVRRIDTLVCVSEDIRANVPEYLPALRGRPRCKLVTISNGIDAGHYQSGGEGGASQALRQELGLAPGVALLGFLGRFMEQKGFLPLLGALERLRSEGAPRPFHLVAVGSGDREREYRKEVERRGLAGHVTFRGFVPDTKPVLRQLDLLVIPSLWEASSLLGMEGMCLGVPVVGTDCIGLREVLRDTPSWVSRAGDEADLARALGEALARPRGEEARGFAGEARGRYDNAPSARRLAELFAAHAR